jgi:hypothetical protein
LLCGSPAFFVACRRDALGALGAGVHWACWRVGAAKLRVGGLRRDGYAVRHSAARCSRIPCAGRSRDPSLAMNALQPSGSRNHPPQAPVLYSRHSPPTRSFAAVRWCTQAAARRTQGRRTSAERWRAFAAITTLQRRAWSGRGANKAQAHTVDGLAARTAPMHRRTAMGRKAFQRGEFGSSAQRCAERRSHRPATRPCAASPRPGSWHLTPGTWHLAIQPSAITRSRFWRALLRGRTSGRICARSWLRLRARAAAVRRLVPGALMRASPS